MLSSQIPSWFLFQIDLNIPPKFPSNFAPYQLHETASLPDPASVYHPHRTGSYPVMGWNYSKVVPSTSCLFQSIVMFAVHLLVLVCDAGDGNGDGDGCAAGAGYVVQCRDTGEILRLLDVTACPSASGHGAQFQPNPPPDTKTGRLRTAGRLSRLMDRDTTDWP